MKKNKIPELKPTKSIGPVQNLEQHLHPEWWKRIFNSMYLKTDADVVDDDRITASEVRFIVDKLELKEGSSLLDLACGQGRHLIELARHGSFNLYGLDRSRYLIQRAKNVSRKLGFNINFKEGDVRKLPYATDSFDYVTILGNSFGYFEASEEDQKILREVFRVLKPDGKLLMDVADGSFLRAHFSPRSWEWIDSNYFVCRERSLAADGERLISREIITHTEKGVLVDQFYAERLYTSEKLMELIDKVGFTKTAFHGTIGSDSLRNQDLGMMETRFILVSTAHKEWTPKRDRKTVKNVVVLMGDPSQNDIIKPDSHFDEDDFYTIDQLKIALSKLPDYKFSYLNNHRSMISDLQRLNVKTDLVLNLCDEGFNNQATNELHVPALLELMDLKFTGSNPQTLASCYDKSLIRGIATEIGVPIADAFIISSDDHLFELNIPFPVIAKPNFGDSSFGITKDNVAYTIEALSDAITRIRKQFGNNKPVLVEEFLTGAELTIGIIGNMDNYMVLPVIEEDFSGLPKGLPHICGYEAKWLPDSPYMKTLKSIRADLPQKTEQDLINYSLKLFDRLEVRDYCRFDWRLNAQGEPKLLEVNPNPGWCWDGHLAKMSAFANLDYSGMLDAILKAAELRYQPPGKE